MLLGAGGAGGGESASGMSSPLSSKSKASPSSSSSKGTLSANTGNRDEVQRDGVLDYITDSENIIYIYVCMYILYICLYLNIGGNVANLSGI